MIKNIDFLYKIDKANKELKKVHDFILSLNNTLLNPVNLKLYDAFFNADDLDKFYFFCEISFDDFREIIKDATNTDFYNLVHYIGRTSSFYCLTDDLYNSIITDRNGVILSDTIYNLFYDLYGWSNILLNFDKNGYIDAGQLCDDVFVYDTDKHDTTCQLDFIISGDFLKEIKAAFNDCIFVYDTIKDFKENQTEYYQDFITANYED